MTQHTYVLYKWHRFYAAAIKSYRYLKWPQYYMEPCLNHRRRQTSSCLWLLKKNEECKNSVLRSIQPYTHPFWQSVAEMGQLSCGAFHLTGAGVGSQPRFVLLRSIQLQPRPFWQLADRAFSRRSRKASVK